jgi:hypothetical protein
MFGIEPIVLVLGGIITIVGILLLMAVWALIRRPRKR